MTDQRPSFLSRATSALGGEGDGVSGFLAAAGPWFQAGAFVFSVVKGLKEKEKARRAQYQQVEISERSETNPVILAYGRSKVRASIVVDRVSNQYAFAALDDSRGGRVFAVPGENRADARFGNARDMTFDTASLSGISFAEFLILQYHIVDAGQFGIEKIVDIDIDKVPWNDAAFKYGQRIHVYYGQNGSVDDPLATANQIRGTNTFNRLAFATGAYRLNVNPFDEGNRGFYKRIPEMDCYLWGRRVRNVVNSGEGSTGTYSNNSMRVLYDILREVGGFPASYFDPRSVKSAIDVCETRLDSLPGLTGFVPQRNGRVWAEDWGINPWLLDSIPIDHTNIMPTLPTDSLGNTPADLDELRRNWLRFEQNDSAGFATIPTGVGVFGARGYYWEFDWSAVQERTVTVITGTYDGYEWQPGEENVPVRFLALSDIRLSYQTGVTSSILVGLQETENAYVRRKATSAVNDQAAVRLGEFNGWFNSFTPLREMVRQVLHTMPWARMIWSSGKLKFPALYPVTQAQEDAAVAMRLTDDDIFELEKQYAPADAAQNQGGITHSDEEQDGAEITGRWPEEGSATHTALLDADGGRRSDIVLQLLGVSTPYHRGIIAEYNVRHSRRTPVYRIAATVRAYALEPGDLIEVTSPTYRTTAARMVVLTSTLAQFGGVSAVILEAVSYSYADNPASQPPQSVVEPPRYAPVRTFLPTGFGVVLNDTARTITAEWNDADIARWGVEAIQGSGDLRDDGDDTTTEDADFAARTDWVEIWTGRDNTAILPLPTGAQTWRMRVRGISTQGIYTRPSRERIVYFPSFVSQNLPRPGGGPILTRNIGDRIGNTVNFNSTDMPMGEGALRGGASAVPSPRYLEAAATRLWIALDDDSEYLSIVEAAGEGGVTLWWDEFPDSWVHIRYDDTHVLGIDHQRNWLRVDITDDVRSGPRFDTTDFVNTPSLSRDLKIQFTRADDGEPVDLPRPGGGPILTRIVDNFGATIDFNSPFLNPIDMDRAAIRGPGTVASALYLTTAQQLWIALDEDDTYLSEVRRQGEGGVTIWWEEFPLQWVHVRYDEAHELALAPSRNWLRVDISDDVLTGPHLDLSDYPGDPSATRVLKMQFTLAESGEGTLTRPGGGPIFRKTVPAANLGAMVNFSSPAMDMTAGQAALRGPGDTASPLYLTTATRLWISISDTPGELLAGNDQIRYFGKVADEDDGGVTLWWKEYPDDWIHVRYGAAVGYPLGYARSAGWMRVTIAPDVLRGPRDDITDFIDTPSASRILNIEFTRAADGDKGDPGDEAIVDDTPFVLIPPTSPEP